MKYELLCWSHCSDLHIHSGNALRNANLSGLEGYLICTVELIVWMLRSNRRCTEFFFQHQVDKAVKQVAETQERLEMFKMFCCGIGVAKHTEPISSLVASAASALSAIGVRFQG